MIYKIIRFFAGMVLSINALFLTVEYLIPIYNQLGVSQALFLMVIIFASLVGAYECFESHRNDT